MHPYKRASQPLGALPPCNAPQSGTSSRRCRAMGAYGSRAAAGAEPAVGASSVVAKSAVLLAVTTSWLQVASWFHPSAPSSLLAPPTFLPPTRTAPHSPPYGRRLERDAPPHQPCNAHKAPTGLIASRRVCFRQPRHPSAHKATRYAQYQPFIARRRSLNIMFLMSSFVNCRFLFWIFLL